MNNLCKILILFLVLLILKNNFTKENFYWVGALPTRLVNNRSYDLRKKIPSYDLRGDPHNPPWYKTGWYGPFFHGLFPFIFTTPLNLFTGYSSYH
tara:strand:+ start:2376 stop:2660 length:285 start_codon:yes stop_codon:yes gene_type:complete